MHAAVISCVRTLCLVELECHACMAFCGHECSMTGPQPSATMSLGGLLFEGVPHRVSDMNNMSP